MLMMYLRHLMIMRSMIETRVEFVRLFEMMTVVVVEVVAILIGLVVVVCHIYLELFQICLNCVYFLLKARLVCYQSCFLS